MSLYIGGLHTVRGVLDKAPESIIQLWALDSKSTRPILALAQSMGIRFAQSSKETLNKKAPDLNHQGIIAEIKAKPEGNEHALKQALSQLPEHSSTWLILEQIQDPRNLGAILRSADGSGVAGVILSKNGTAPLTPTVRKVACGASEHLKLYRVNALNRTLNHLKEAGIWTYALSDSANQSIYEADFRSGHNALVLGSEGDGLKNGTLSNCDHTLSIPMAGYVSSLNVSVAAAVTLYEMVRQKSH